MERNSRKVLTGVVKKKSGTQTVKVEVEQMLRHLKYKKVIKMHKNFLVHDENSSSKVGEKVLIMETRPISKNKTWRIVKSVEN